MVVKITPMADRKYEMIPIDSIEVLNSRNRDRLQFDRNIRSIKSVGLLKPVVVNDRRFEKTGRYELICLPLRLKGLDGAPVRAVLRRPATG